MINDNLKIIHKNLPNLKEDAKIIKYIKGGKLLNLNSIKHSDLKLINLKSRSGSNSLKNDEEETFQNFINFPVNEKNISFLTIRNNHINIRRSDVPLPKINKVKIKRPTNSLEKRKNISFSNDLTSKWIKKLSINNKENYSFFHKNSLNNKEENKERNISSNSSNGNKIIFNQESLNLSNNKRYMKIPKNFSFQRYNKSFKNESNSIKLNNNATPNPSTSRIINPILGLTKIPTHILNRNSNSHKKLKKIIQIPPPIPVEPKESKERIEKLNILNNIFKTIGSASPLNITGIIPFKKEVQLSSEIFLNNYRNFQESIISKKEDISKTDIIKGYAYNTSVGNIRSYNEDEICISKIFFNINDKENDKYDINNNNFCHFFAIYDGHGGKGCSSFLKDNLHKYITEFSPIGIKIGIDMAEDKFKTKRALNEKGNLVDQSGSCGIMLMIKGNKCIVANIGDSRLVIFRNNSISFVTMDHKPDSIIEKARIELSGGKIYKTQTLLPVYQNGIRINSPWRVLPGRLSVSRTFGDISAKDENFGGNKTAIIALPDINEIELDDEYNFIVMGCDGIFDVLKNEELLECIEIVLKEKQITNLKNVDIHELCGDFAAMIIKSALAKDSFDNVSCIVIAINLESLLAFE